MANLAEAIQGLVQHMRSEQQMIRDWADEQAKLNRDLRRFMEHARDVGESARRSDRIGSRAAEAPWRSPAAVAIAA